MRRSTSAALVFTAVLALFAGPLLHAPAHGIDAPAIAAQAAAPGAGAISGDRDRGPRPHDHDLCPICRATAQARLALRAPARITSLAMEGGGGLPLPRAALAAPPREPVLSNGPARAPPVLVSALEA
jgi:hypothetical protein